MSQARAALALRLRVLGRRHGTPLDALLLAGLVGLGWLAGRELSRELGPLSPARAAAFATAALAAIAAVGSVVAHDRLYRARELVLLLAHPLGARDLVRVRLVELALAGTLVGAVLVGAIVGAGPGVSPPALEPGLAATAAGGLLASVLLGAWLAGMQLLLAWGRARLGAALPRVARAVTAAAGPIGLGAVGAAVGLRLVAPEGLALPWGSLEAALAASWLPGAPVVALAGGALGAPALGVLLAWALAAGALALVVAPTHHGELLSALAPRSPGASGLARALDPVLRALTLPLPPAARALVRRDLALLLRGAFPRGFLVLGLLPLGLLVFREAANDRKLEAWTGELAALMTSGVLASFAGFLFAIDFPNARARRLVLERAQPLRGRDVLIARTFEASLPALVLALGLGVVAARGSPAAAERAEETTVAAALMAVACAHHAAVFGLRGEAAGRGAELATAASFPFAAGLLVVVLAVALAISPWTFALYPFVWGSAGGATARAWERSEVATPGGSAA